jgi:uncharacterized membrane protein YcaP (DUF421 family)
MRSTLSSGRDRPKTLRDDRPGGVVMRHALVGEWGSLGLVATKAALLFLVAVLGMRVSARRTLAELSVFDFVTAVAVGAVVGRVPNASDTSFVAGAVTLVVLLVLHRILGTARVTTRRGRVLDHRPVLLVRRGAIDTDALRQSQLTDEDLASMLRSRGVADLGEAELVVFEPGGAVSVVRADQTDGDLVRGLIADESA